MLVCFDSPYQISFQSTNQLDDGIRMMGEKPDEIWGRINSKASEISTKRIIGRPRIKKRGPKVNLTVQLQNLFSRRNKIVHQADLSLSKKLKGKERQIKYNVVKRWVDSVEKMITKIDSNI